MAPSAFERSIIMKKIAFLCIFIAVFVNSTNIYAVKRSPYFPDAEQVGDKVEFIDERAFPVRQAGTSIPITLTEEQNTIEIECTDISNLTDEYYINLCEEEVYLDMVGHKPIKEFRCPVRLSKFKLCGLEGGKKYIISFSSTGNVENVSGTLTASYTEEIK